jgi:hypothetical protein
MRHQLNVTRNVPQILTHLNLWAYIDSYLLAAAVSTILYDTYPLYYYFTVTHIHFWHSYQHIDQPITHPHEMRNSDVKPNPSRTVLHLSAVGKSRSIFLLL